MNKQNRNIPKFLSWFLDFFTEESDKSHLNGDYKEIFGMVYKNDGKIRALLWVFRQIFKSAILYISNSIVWSVNMFKNYFKIAWRNILRNKMFSFINISGLAVGMTCCILMSIWIINEFNYDKFHENIDTIYGAVFDQNFEGEKWRISSTPIPLGPALSEEFPEVLAAARVWFFGQILMNHKIKSFNEKNVYFVDPSFLQMFSFSFLNGDKNTALNDPFSIVISKDIAEKYFSETNPLGQYLTINNEYNFIVTGIIENVPQNSSLRFNILLPFEFRKILNQKRGWRNDEWGFNITWTFIQIKDKTFAGAVNSRIKNFVKEKSQNEIATEFSIVPLKNMRFSPYYGDPDRKKYLLTVTIIALFILLIACINFMNLSTARSAYRAKEIGLRKVVGACRKNIITQFLGESLLLSFLAFLLALILVIFMLPVFNNLFRNNLFLGMIGENYVLPVLIGITFLTGLFSGSYPALFLSSFKPVIIFKGILASGSKNSVLRKVFVVFQFVLSISFIIGTIVAYKQQNFLKSADLGYNPKNIVIIPLSEGNYRNYDAVKNILQSDSRILSVTGIHQKPPFIWSNTTSADWPGNSEKNKTLIHFGFVHYDYIKTLTIESFEGRDFSTEFPSDRNSSFIVNDEMVKLMGTDYAIGKSLLFGGQEGKIIGVVKNFHFQSLRTKTPPLVLVLRPDEVRCIVIRISPYDISSTMDFIKNTWKKTNSAYPFIYSFLDSDYTNFYRSEKRTGSILMNSALLAILIACLGLFGLASYIAELRTKEFGIRKVLGASAPALVNLLSKEFLILVLLSNFIAWPVSWYLMDKWLQNFAYRTNIGWFPFIGAAVIAIVLSMVTVVVQTVKAATANPVDTLKYE